MGSALEALQEPPLHRPLIDRAAPAGLSQPASARALCSWQMLCLFRWLFLLFSLLQRDSVIVNVSVLNVVHSKNVWILRRSTPTSRRKHRGKPKNWRKFGPCLWLQSQRLVSKVLNQWSWEALELGRVSHQLCNAGKCALCLEMFFCTVHFVHIIQKY